LHSRVWYTAQTLDACLRRHDNQAVIPAHAGIQESYIQWQAALEVMEKGYKVRSKLSLHGRHR